MPVNLKHFHECFTFRITLWRNDHRRVFYHRYYILRIGNGHVRSFIAIHIRAGSLRYAHYTFWRCDGVDGGETHWPLSSTRTTKIVCRGLHNVCLIVE